MLRPYLPGYRRAESFLRFSISERGAILTCLFIPPELRRALSYFPRLCRTRASRSDVSKVLKEPEALRAFSFFTWQIPLLLCDTRKAPSHMKTASYF